MVLLLSHHISARTADSVWGYSDRAGPAVLCFAHHPWKTGTAMKKLKNEAELLKEAIRTGMEYGEKRGVVEFEPTDSANEKIEYIYKLLVHDKVIQPLAKEQVSIPNMKHKLALWVSRKLPSDHPLLK
jgi:hypothetical protein